MLLLRAHAGELATSLRLELMKTLRPSACKAIKQSSRIWARCALAGLRNRLGLSREVLGSGRFFEDTGFGSGIVLRDAVADGKDVLRVERGGELKFADTAANLTEEMVGEIMLILVSVRVNDEDGKESCCAGKICRPVLDSGQDPFPRETLGTPWSWLHMPFGCDYMGI